MTDVVGTDNAVVNTTVDGFVVNIIINETMVDVVGNEDCDVSVVDKIVVDGTGNIVVTALEVESNIIDDFDDDNFCVVDGEEVDVTSSFVTIVVE